MSTTLLAVDDSATMRKVLEITFAGTDLRMLTAESPDAALQSLKAEDPALVIADATLEPQNGYELCKAIKQASPGTQVLILSSKQTPYDAAAGSDAGADDHMDKPFDTQQMIDKVTKMLGSKPAAAGAPAPAPAAARAAPAATAAATPGGRAKTLLYNPAAGGPPPAGMKPAEKAAPAPTPVTGVPVKPAAAPAPKPAPKPAPAAAKAPAAAASAMAASSGDMAAKLSNLGLNKEQVESVLALSQEVVERVVWEVVPVLAETLIKEEIARLTK